ncbi:hypothetical protein [Thermoflexus hugenholtzii]
MAEVYHAWRADETTRNDYNPSPSRYVSLNEKDEALPLEEAVVHLLKAKEERVLKEVPSRFG